MARLAVLTIFALLQIGAPPSFGQSGLSNTVSIDLENAVVKIKGQLESQFVISKTNPEGTVLVAPGTLFVLRKENLIVNKVLLNNGRPSTPVQNTYENGQISPSGLLGALGKLNSLLGGSRPSSLSRSLDIGTKLWVTNISVQTSGIEFQLMSAAINGDVFHGSLKFPIVDVATAERVTSVIPEVLATDQPIQNVAAAPMATPAGDEQRLRMASEAGDPEAMFQSGNVLAQQGDFVGAVRWFERASNKGHVSATNALGYMYDEGKGVPQNFARASALYLRAMKRGDTVAMVNRGLMILNGKGVVKDSQQAYMHFLLAAAYARDDNSRAAALKLKEDVEGKLTKQQIARGQAMADKFAKEEIR